MSFNCPEYIKEFTRLVQSLKIKTSLEIGYGSGELVEALRAIGINAGGIDQSTELSGGKKTHYLRNISMDDYVAISQNDPSPDQDTPNYDLVYSSGVLEHFSPEGMIDALKKMASLSKKFILTIVPNKNCAAYMATKAKTAAEWKDEAAFDGDELRAIHEAAGLITVGSNLGTGLIGKEWPKRFGPQESEPYLVFCLAQVPYTGGFISNKDLAEISSKSKNSIS